SPGRRRVVLLDLPPLSTSPPAAAPPLTRKATSPPSKVSFERDRGDHPAKSSPTPSPPTLPPRQKTLSREGVSAGASDGHHITRVGSIIASSRSHDHHHHSASPRRVLSPPALPAEGRGGTFTGGGGGATGGGAPGLHRATSYRRTLMRASSK